MLHFDDLPPRKARIEIIPMIDVMMFLLIFFVLISLNVIPAFGLKTALPDSKTAQRATIDQPPIVVSILDDGSTAIGSSKVSKEQLAPLVLAAHRDKPESRFVVSADQGVRWQTVVDVMDILRAQGIEAVTFATKKVGG